MPTPGYLLNKYNRTLGSKTRLLQKRLAIEGDISAKKYAADQKKLSQGINIAGTVGAGLAEYSTAEKGGYKGGMMGYLEEKAKEHYGLDGSTTSTTTVDGKKITQISSGGTGVKETDYRAAFDIGVDERKAAAGEWWENVKGLVPTSIGESKVGKHWRSEGKDFLKKSLGIGEPKGGATLQTGEPLVSSAQQQYNTEKQNRLKEYQGHTLFSQIFGEQSGVTTDKPPTTREGDLAKLSFPEEETVGPYNLRTQYSPDYQGDSRGDKEYLKDYKKAKIVGGLSDFFKSTTPEPKLQSGEPLSTVLTGDDYLEQSGLTEKKVLEHSQAGRKRDYAKENQPYIDMWNELQKQKEDKETSSIGFKEAFAAARKAGKTVFTWNNKSYSTQLGATI